MFLRVFGFIIAGLLSFSFAIGQAYADPIAAKKLFGAARKPSPLAARAIGSYAKGCLAGGRMLPVDGPAWQAMRLSRNRNWGHPALVKYVERLATDSKTVDKWPGLLIGDLAQPRGGPMLSGHASHQLGLDADIWLMPMPGRKLERKEREKISAISVLGADKLSVNQKIWKPGHVTLLKRAATYPEVARIFVHPAIKKALCDAAPQNDREWLRVIRPWWGHHYHFHVRLKCPEGSVGCKNQPAPPAGDGCGKQLTHWFKVLKGTLKKPKKPVIAKKKKKKYKKRRALRITDLPSACMHVLGLNNVPRYLRAKIVPLPERRPVHSLQANSG